jgi:hypothetical protein
MTAHGRAAALAVSKISKAPQRCGQLRAKFFSFLRLGLRPILTASLILLAACGGGPRSESGTTASTPGVVVAGRVAERGTRSSILVFAYTDLAPNEEPAAHEPVSVGMLAPDGTFDIDVPAAASLTLVFLADGANDGVADAGDPIAVLAGPELVDLQPGDRVQVSDAALDFRQRRVTATVEITRAGEPARTPTPAP